MAIRKTRTTTRRATTGRKPAKRILRPWTREEMAFMRKYYRKFETTWIARQLGRTVYAVRYKAVDLSLKKASPSIWRGNTGPAKAFRKPTARKTTRKPVARKATKRRTTTKRTWKASTPKRRVARKSVKRRSTRRSR